MKNLRVVKQNMHRNGEMHFSDCSILPPTLRTRQGLGSFVSTTPHKRFYVSVNIQAQSYESPEFQWMVSPNKGILVTQDLHPLVGFWFPLFIFPGWQFVCKQSCHLVSAVTPDLAKLIVKSTFACVACGYSAVSVCDLFNLADVCRWLNCSSYFVFFDKSYF